MSRLIEHQGFATLVLVSLLFLGIVSCPGCGQPITGCSDPPKVYPFEYERKLSIAADSDSVLMMVNYDWAAPLSIDRQVFVDTQASKDDSLRIRMHIIGESYERRFPPLRLQEPGVVDYRWSNDTLRVWCGLYSPQSWVSGPSGDKCTPKEPWISPARIDVVLPEGVGFRYIRYHSNWH